MKHTHTHGVRGTGREDQVPARAVAAIREGGRLASNFHTVETESVEIHPEPGYCGFQVCVVSRVRWRVPTMG